MYDAKHAFPRAWFEAVETHGRRDAEMIIKQSARAGKIQKYTKRWDQVEQGMAISVKYGVADILGLGVDLQRVGSYSKSRRSKGCDIYRNRRGGRSVIDLDSCDTGRWRLG